jgi:DNA replication licensing factor MCM6
MPRFLFLLSSFVDQADQMDVSSPAPSGPRRLYIELIKALKEFELTTLYLDFSHLLSTEMVLAKAISEQYYR